MHVLFMYDLGADPGFFLGGVHIAFLIFLQNTSCIRKPLGHLRGRGGGGVAPPATPLDLLVIIRFC